jgi:WD40 repeat protein
VSQNWKTVRVFISSTFRDMQTERNHLVRKVFPELKERCRKRHVQLIDVDLRWGVTQDEAEGGGALDICLDEIDTCRPYFLGLLGQRYGYIPPNHPHSITAEEIYHGVLHNDLPHQLLDLRPFVEGIVEGRTLTKDQIDCLMRCYLWNPEKGKYILKGEISPEDEKTLRSVFDAYSIYQKDRSFFFFRSEPLTRELADTKIDDYFEADESVKVKLAGLKQEIVDAGLSYFEYKDIETFGQKVLETLWGRISTEFLEEREEAKRDWLKEEAEFHELFMADRTRRFVGRGDILKRMHAFVEEDSESGVMAVIGEPGCGKSALMARFAEQVIRRHPDWLILSHFVGASPSSTSLRRSLRRVCAELYRALGVTAEVPEDYKELTQLFPELLRRTGEKRRILLIFDALNQFERVDNAQAMRWLPQELPPKVKAVVSTLAGEVLDALRAWRFQPRFEELGGLTELETELFVNSYLKEVRKEFPTPQIRDAFFDKIRAGHPLYILVALEELRVFPVYDEVGKRVAGLPDSVPELFDQVLERVECDFNRSLVRDFLSFIACGRQGMTGEEMQELLSKYSPVVESERLVEKLPDMLFSRLRRALAAYLFERSGVIDFFHGQLKEAVGKRYLQAASDRVGVHRVIGEYFEGRWREPYLRAVEELPHQLTKAEEWDGVERVLCDLRFVEAKCGAGMTFDLVHDYVVALGALPEAQSEVQERLRQEAMLKKYTNDLIAFAKGKIDHLEIIPSVKPWSEEKMRLDTDRVVNNPTRLDRIRAFSQFVNSESHALLKFASCLGFTVQQAYNSARTGPVALAAESIISAKTNQVMFLHLVSQRPDHNPHMALLRTFEGHKGSVFCVSLAPDGKRAVSASFDRTLKVWDAESGECLKTLQGHTDTVRSVSLTPDGRIAVSASDDKTLKVWDLESGTCLKTLYGHTGWIMSVSLSQDGKIAVSASWDKTLKIWDVESGACLKTLYGHTDAISCVDLTSDGKKAISCSSRTLKLWDLDSGECFKTLIVTGGINHVALTPDGRRAVAANSDNTVKVWDVDSGACLKTLQGHTSIVTSVSLSLDGKIAVSASWDKTLKIWDVESGACLKTLYGNTGIVMSVSLSLDGKIAVSANDDNNTFLWNIESGESFETQLDHVGGVTSVSLAPDGKRAVSAGVDRTLKVWDAESGECLKTLYGHTGWIMSVSLTPDGRIAVSASDDKTLKVWDLESGTCLKTIQAHRPGVRSVSLTSDGKIAVSASDFSPLQDAETNILKVWDLESGTCLKTLRGHTGFVQSVSLTPDSRIAVTASRDETLKVWDLDSGECLNTLRGHGAEVTSVRLTADGKRAISVCGFHSAEDITGYLKRHAFYPKTLKVWDLESGTCLKTLQGHTSKITSVRLTPDSRTAVTASLDATLKVWDLDSGESLATYHANGPLGPVSSVTTTGHFAIATGFAPKVIFVTLRNLAVETPFVTPVRLWLYEKGRTCTFEEEKASISWDDNITVACPSCSKRFPVSEEKLEMIRSINQSAGVSHDQSPCLELPSEAWNDPRLLSECPICHKPLRLNPFVVDNSWKKAEKNAYSNIEMAGEWFNKGNSLYGLGRFDEAIKCYDKALTINPKHVDACFKKGISYVKVGRLDEATQCCNTILDINPQYSKAWFLKGVCEHQLGLAAYAATSYRKFIELAAATDAELVNSARQLLRQLEKK